VNAFSPAAVASLAIALAVWLAPLIGGQAEASPMQTAMRALACGETVAEVERGLDALEAAPTAPFGVPDESLAGTDLELDSGAYDSLLDSLALARQRFPELGMRILALLERWDFCALTARGERWDLAVGEADQGVVRRRPARMSPLLGSGYAAWGLLPRSAGGRPRFVEGSMLTAPAGSVAQSPQCREGGTLQLTPMGPLPMAVDEGDDVDETCAPPPPTPPPAPPPEKVAPEGAHGQGEAATAAKAARAPTTGEVTAEDSREVASPDTRDAAATLPGTISASLTASATGNLNLGTGVSLAPWRNTFVRAGLSWRLVTDWDEAAATPSDAEPSWSWGIGYDD
jgi:hypothetical protein